MAKEMKNKGDILNEIAIHLQVRWYGYGTWRITSYVSDKDGKRLNMSCFSNNEEDCTGIFDGATYNKSVPTIAEIAEEQKVNFAKAKRIRDGYLNDPANEDNYEPREQREARLAERLFNLYDDEIEEVLCG